MEIIHACVPETIDRFYQEVGRGGRDGRASVSFLIYTERDRNIASGLGQPSIITKELGLERWKAIWYDSKWDDLVLLAKPLTEIEAAIEVRISPAGLRPMLPSMAVTVNCHSRRRTTSISMTPINWTASTSFLTNGGHVLQGKNDHLFLSE